MGQGQRDEEGTTEQAEGQGREEEDSVGAWETGSSWKQRPEPVLGDEGTRILGRGLTRISIGSQLLERLPEAGRPEPPQLQGGGASQVWAGLRTVIRAGRGGTRAKPEGAISQGFGDWQRTWVGLDKNDTWIPRNNNPEGVEAGVMRVSLYPFTEC